MKLVIEESPKTVTVITPTIGSPKLWDAVESVKAQTYPCKHLIVADGPGFYDDAWQIAKSIYKLDGYDGLLQVECSPENTGANGFNGQRIYAAYPHLVNSDYVAFLDEDNWFEPNHVEECVKTITETNLDWCHSLRNIYNVDEFVCQDNCESLGKWQTFHGVHHVDTNIMRTIFTIHLHKLQYFGRNTSND